MTEPVSHIDTTNHFLVGGLGDRIVVVHPMKLIQLAQQGITHDEALNLAAWLVALAYESNIDFDALLAAVKSS